MDEAFEVYMLTLELLTKELGERFPYLYVYVQVFDGWKNSNNYATVVGNSGALFLELDGTLIKTEYKDSSLRIQETENVELCDPDAIEKLAALVGRCFL